MPMYKSLLQNSSFQNSIAGIAALPVARRAALLTTDKTAQRFVKAFVLAYLSTTVPKSASILVKYLGNRRKYKLNETMNRIMAVFGTGLRSGSFPLFCAVFIGGYTEIESNLYSAVSKDHRTQATFAAAVVSAAVSMGYIHHVRPNIETIDLTLMASVSAIDVVMHQLFRSGFTPLRILPKTVIKNANALAFASACTVIMYSWFFFPERLPSSYMKWITDLSQTDQSLLDVLKAQREGKWHYGKESEKSQILVEFSERIGLNGELGDPRKTIPIPKIVYHTNKTHSCEVHAAWRFASTFKEVMKIYVPLMLLSKLRKPSLNAVYKAFKASARSSAFLSLFVTLLWYSICNMRCGRVAAVTKPKTNKDWTDLEVIRGPLLGSLLCGWSVLIEPTYRRTELALFGNSLLSKNPTNNCSVAPRAIASLLPQDTKTGTIKRSPEMWKESLAFAVSMGFILMAIQEKKLGIDHFLQARGPFANAVSLVL